VAEFPVLLLGPSGERIYNAAPTGSVSVPTPSFYSPWLGPVLESFPGAWQRNIVVDSQKDLLAFAAVQACVSLISDDVATFPLDLVELDDNEIWNKVNVPAYSPVLRRPNRFQTKIQFISYWMTSKLIHGNAYVLKERDARRVVTAMYVLDPRHVLPLISPDSTVYYQVGADVLAGVPPSESQSVFPASEIIHDRGPTPFHPLVGVSALYACGTAATQGRRIQANSEQFFANMSRPSGMLTAPGDIDEPTAHRLKTQWENAYGGANLGRTFVGGSDLKYIPLTINAEDAQLIQQLDWTDKNVAMAFKVPPSKIGIRETTVGNAAQHNQEYYNQALKRHVGDIEALLDDGLGLGPVYGNRYGVALDVEAGLLWMDSKTQAEVNDIEIKGGALTINEARRLRNRRPVDGGNVPFMQQQMFPVSELAQRGPPDAAPVSAPADDDTEDDEEANAMLIGWSAHMELRQELGL
jgi:HK97 family phage portal protein